MASSKGYNAEDYWHALRASNGVQHEAARRLGVQPASVTGVVRYHRKNKSIPADIQEVLANAPRRAASTKPRPFRHAYKRWRFTPLDERSTLSSVLVTLEDWAALRGLSRGVARQFVLQNRVGGLVESTKRASTGHPIILLVPFDAPILNPQEAPASQRRQEPWVLIADYARDQGVTVEALEWLGQRGFIRIVAARARRYIREDTIIDDRLRARAALKTGGELSSVAGRIRLLKSRGVKNAVIAEALGVTPQRVAEIVARARSKGELPPATPIPKDQIGKHHKRTHQPARTKGAVTKSTVPAELRPTVTQVLALRPNESMDIVLSVARAVQQLRLPVERAVSLLDNGALQAHLDRQERLLKGEHCPAIEASLRMGYNAFFHDCEQRAARGEKQKQCPMCRRWKWEFCEETTTLYNAPLALGEPRGEL